MIFFVNGYEQLARLPDNVMLRVLIICLAQLLTLSCIFVTCLKQAKDRDESSRIVYAGHGITLSVEGHSVQVYKP